MMMSPAPAPARSALAEAIVAFRLPDELIRKHIHEIHQRTGQFQRPLVVKQRLMGRSLTIDSRRLCHSYRSASMGSSCAALRAG